MYFRSWSPSIAWLILSLLTSIATVWTGIPLITCPSWIMSNSGSFIRTARWYTNRYSKWNEYYPRAISRYKRRTNAMCMTLLCLRGLRRQSRHCGPDTASRSPGGPSYTRTLRWVIGLWWEADWQVTSASTHQVHPSGQVIRKGVLPDIDSYSAFFDNSKLSKTALEEIIKKELVSDIYVCGIATDVCVGKMCLLSWKMFPLYILYKSILATHKL